MQKLLEYHRDLYKCILMEINKDVHVEEHRTSKHSRSSQNLVYHLRVSGDITLTAWMKMWDRIMKGALALAHLPQWVQVMPYNLFTYIDKNGKPIVPEAMPVSLWAPF